jgi:serine/threonine protein kinase
MRYDIYGGDMTNKEIAERIVKDEQTYTVYVKSVAEMLGFELDEYNPYILGKGVSAIVYLVKRDNIYFALKFIKEVIETYGQLIIAQDMISEYDLSRYVPKFICTFSKYTPTILPYEINLPEYAIIIQEYTGLTLKEFIPLASLDQLYEIIDQLREIKNAFENAGLIHDDIYDENITVKVFISGKLKVFIIDLDAVKPAEKQEYNGLTNIDIIINKINTLIDLD